jgi:hypothetical protein
LQVSKELEYEPIQVSGLVTALCAVVKPPVTEKGNKLHFLLMSVQEEKGVRIAPWPRKVLSPGISSTAVFYA